MNRRFPQTISCSLAPSCPPVALRHHHVGCRGGVAPPVMLERVLRKKSARGKGAPSRGRVRESGVSGTRVSVRVELVGRRMYSIKTTRTSDYNQHIQYKT